MKSIVIRLLLCCSLLGPAAVAVCQTQPSYRWGHCILFYVKENLKITLCVTV